jgi:FixJ family two-component response regulator
MAGERLGSVAIVDNDPAILASLRFLLSHLGREILTYETATDFLQSLDPKPLCLILDQHMPQMTGLELAAILHELAYDIPILLITAAPDHWIMSRAADLGIQEVLEKPLSEMKLISFIEGYR